MKNILAFVGDEFIDVGSGSIRSQGRTRITGNKLEQSLGGKGNIDGWDYNETAGTKSRQAAGVMKIQQGSCKVRNGQLGSGTVRLGNRRSSSSSRGQEREGL